MCLVLTFDHFFLFMQEFMYFLQHASFFMHLPLKQLGGGGGGENARFIIVEI